MKIFEEKVNELFQNMGDFKNMVLSTSANEHVSSRMMSVIMKDQRFLFQTDMTFRKYNQIQANPNVALCFENIQIEGICEDIGRANENETFCEQYKLYFMGSYEKYSNMERERLMEVRPTFIQKWIYENGQPYVITFDFFAKDYQKKRYDLLESDVKE